MKANDSFESFELIPAGLTQAFDTAIRRAEDERFVERLFAREAEVYGKTGAALDSINNRLGWLDVVEEMRGKVEEINGFVSDVLADGYRQVVILGMGGSSLAPEVFKLIFGPRPELKSIDMLDSTDPAMIVGLLGRLDLPHTLFIVASKSGKTVETLSHAKFFYDQVERAKVTTPGRNFVAITDAGSFLQEYAAKKSFRHVFLNPADIGGRYSALSYFGLVPAAFTKIDLDKALQFAQKARQDSASSDYQKNSALRLGVFWAVAAERGLDKLTFVVTDSLKPFVPWAEQLIAESTGKEGKAVIPIEGEPQGAMSDYGPDRLFIFMSVKGDDETEHTRLYDEVLRSGAPMMALRHSEPEEIGYEFFRMEMATATAGYVMGINPFDEPNVQESKDNTATLLQELEEKGAFPQPQVIAVWDGLEVLDVGVSDSPADSELANPNKLVKRFFTGLRKDSYVAILNYFERTEETEAELAKLRSLIRSRFGVATLRGYGPRFLHSIGQLYKGGPAQGHFIVLTRTDRQQLEIPDSAFTFNQLKAAQALGDTQAFVRRELPTLMINCSVEPATAISAFSEQVARSFKVQKTGASV